jgi:hypothetical protein
MLIRGIKIQLIKPKQVICGQLQGGKVKENRAALFIQIWRWMRSGKKYMITKNLCLSQNRELTVNALQGKMVW